jgi:hypothetical protein
VAGEDSFGEPEADETRLAFVGDFDESRPDQPVQGALSVDQAVVGVVQAGRDLLGDQERVFRRDRERLRVRGRDERVERAAARFTVREVRVPLDRIQLDVARDGRVLQEIVDGAVLLDCDQDRLRIEARRIEDAEADERLSV